MMLRLQVLCLSLLWSPCGSLAQIIGHATQVKAAYSTAPFDGTLKPGYRGNDVRSIFKVLELRTSLAKDEFEDSDHYAARLDRAKALPIAGSLDGGSQFAFVIPSDLNNHLNYTYNTDLIANYDADKQLMTVHVLTDEKHPVEAHDKIVTDAFVWGGDQPAFSAYVGQNSFGASTQIKKTTSDVYGIAFDVSVENWNDSSKRFSSLGPGIELSFKIKPEEAKKAKPSLRALVVCRLTDRPTLSAVAHEEPTLRLPFDVTTRYHFVHVDPLEVWIYNNATAEVYVKNSEIFSELSEQAATGNR